MLRRVLALLGICAARLGAQEPMIPSSEIMDYVRMLELLGQASGTPLVYWSSSTAPRTGGLQVDAGHLWSTGHDLTARVAQPRGLEVRPLRAYATMVYNSAFPRTSNDGALWAGKGLSAIISAGLDLRWGPLSARLQPELTYSENRSFPLATGPGTSRSPFAYPWHIGIDYPQRFGSSAYTTLDWGQSGLRLDVGAFTAGISTENLWWGPSHRNAIIMGSAAPGFPHLDMGTGRPVRTLAGDIEFRVLWGQLSASRYSGTFPDAGRRFLAGFTAGYRPKFIPGLTLGATRVLYRDWRFVDWTGGGMLRAFTGFFNSRTTLQSSGTYSNDLDDQLASLTARWAFPEVGFEAYAEYARNDFSGDARDLIVQPDHSRGYTAGFRKVLTPTPHTWVLTGEATDLANPRIDDLRIAPTYYVHSPNLEGYTNRGQLLGAAIGPGSSSQYLGLDRYSARGRWSVFLEHIRYDDDYAVPALTGVTNGFRLHQVDLTAGVSILCVADRFDWGGSLEVTSELNRYFVERSDVTNVRLSFMVSRR